MSKFDNDLLKYAEELGVEEAVIYPPQPTAGQPAPAPTAVKPGVPGVPGQAPALDLQTMLAAHPDMQQHIAAKQKADAAYNAAAQKALADIQKQIQLQLQQKGQQAGNPAGAAQVAPTATAPVR